MSPAKKIKTPPQYNCPFCDKLIPPSKKTEIFFESTWIDGCRECYLLSIHSQLKKFSES